MTMKVLSYAVLLIAVAVLVPVVGMSATPGCDSFGQDWSITLGAFGGSFPATYLVSGCRDCDGSLGCGGDLPLDGDVVKVAHKNGHKVYVWSLTAYSPPGSTCSSTHWTGSSKKVTLGGVINGNVSNNFGPFGAFTLTLAACPAVAIGGRDPSTHVSGAAFQKPPTN
jgi:hypothetical protein